MVKESKSPAAPDAVNAVAFAKVTVSLLMVNVPELPPMAIVVAAPPMLIVVALLLKREAVVVVVVMSPPFNAKSPAEVTLPVAPVTEKFVPVISLAPKEIALTSSASETSNPFVIPPAAA